MSEGFLHRWVRRKAQAPNTLRDSETDSGRQTTPHSGDINTLHSVKNPVKTDADMPPVESLTEDSDVIGFLSDGISEELRKLALRKLFHTPKFNVRDGLDDYDDDYRSFASLGDIITSDMRHEMEQMALTEQGALNSETIDEPASKNTLTDKGTITTQSEAADLEPNDSIEQDVEQTNTDHHSVDS